MKNFILIIVSLSFISSCSNDKDFFLNEGNALLSCGGKSRIVVNDKEEIKAIYFVCYLCLIIGLYLVIKGGWIILLIGATSLIFAYLYTATSFSIAYNGYGDFFVFLYFGLIASVGTVFLQTNSYHYEGFLIGCITGCLNVALLVVNNIRDVKEDSITNKKTLIVRFGTFFGKIEFVFMMVAPFFFIYQLLTLLNKQILFYSYSTLGVFGIILIYKIFNSKSFLESKALKHLSIYMTLLTVLLVINL